VTGKPVRLVSARYVLRSVMPQDASEGWQRWSNDPEAARWLNAPQREVSRDDIVKYISTFDNQKSYLIGIFEKESSRLIGIHAIYVDWQRGEYLINVMIGEQDARNKGARSEARIAVHDHFMDVLGLGRSVSTVVDGHPQLAQMMRWGWTVEGAIEKPSASGGPPVKVLVMNLTRSNWHRARAGNTAERRPNP
jgi:RimJ/RimL family protein N-acetyltransferase